MERHAGWICALLGFLGISTLGSCALPLSPDGRRELLLGYVAEGARHRSLTRIVPGIDLRTGVWGGLKLGFSASCDLLPASSSAETGERGGSGFRLPVAFAWEDDGIVHTLGWVFRSTPDELAPGKEAAFAYHETLVGFALHFGEIVQGVSIGLNRAGLLVADQDSSGLYSLRFEGIGAPGNRLVQHQ